MGQVSTPKQRCGREQGIWGTHAALRVLHRVTDSGVMWPVPPALGQDAQKPCRTQDP